jgi:hypothetical protein
MMFPLVLDLAADGIPVAVTCRALGFSKQAFYAWKRSPVSGRDWADAHLINAAVDIHHDDPAFGYRFIADELASLGIKAGENRVARLCSQQQIWSVFAKKRGLSRKVGPPVHDDLVNRQFTADRPDELWLTDITEHPTAEGKALPVRDQGRLLGANRGLLHGQPDESVPSRGGAAQRDRAALTRRDSDHPFGQGEPIPLPRLCPPAARQWADRVDGPGRGLR